MFFMSGKCRELIIFVPMKTLTDERYECLRGHLSAAFEILRSLEVEPGTKVPGKSPRETKKQKMAKYDKLIISGERAKKPAYLKKK